MQWTASQIPDLSGKTALVTGANSGLGLHTAQALAASGASVVMACRGQARAEGAMQQIRSAVPNAKLEFLPLDLSSLASVRKAAEQFKAQHRQLDILCNNAGLMGLPLSQTEDGFEMLFGTNHLGHFALTGLLMQPLLAAPAARIVALTSVTHRQGKLPLDDLLWQRQPYSKVGAYSRSKLANLLFANELQRRLEKSGAKAISLSAHPGYAATNIVTGGSAAPPSFGRRLWNSLAAIGNVLVAQPADRGALPTLYAATAPEAKGGDCIGPDGPFEFRGYPKRVGTSVSAQDRVLAKALWEHSEALTGVKWL